MFPLSQRDTSNDLNRTDRQFSAANHTIVIDLSFGLVEAVAVEESPMKQNLISCLFYFFFFAAGVMLVMIEIESNNTNYEQNHFHQRHPFQAQWSFGLSYFLAWICLITFAAIGGLFIVYSRKRKLDIAADRGFSLS